MSTGEQLQDQVLAVDEHEGAAAGELDVGLHQRVLSDGRVFGQSIAGVGPSLGAAALIPLAYAEAAGAGWLTVVIGTLGVLAVGGSITILARRYASAGALYNLNAEGLGQWAGLLTGFAVVALVALILPSCTIGFAQTVSAFTSSIGLGALSSTAMFVCQLVFVCGATVLAYRDIRVSTSLFLVIEFVSMLLIVVLLIVVLAHSSVIFETAQLTLSGASVHGTLVGVVFMILAFTGFEGATSLGLESRRPRRAVPLALLGGWCFSG